MGLTRKKKKKKEFELPSLSGEKRLGYREL